jgi:hypothetical protein
LKHLHCDVEINIQEGYGHGFLNLVYLIPEVKNSLELLSIWLLHCLQTDSTSPKSENGEKDTLIRNTEHQHGPESS